MSPRSDDGTQMPKHHPEADLLVEYASGSLREPVALLIATHLALCPQCRADTARLESVGGVLLEQLSPTSMSPGSLGKIIAKLDEPAEPEQAPLPAPPGDIRIPRPLRDYLASIPGRDGDDRWAGLPWQKRFKALSEIPLLPEFPGFRTRLLKIAGGSAMPSHTHLGMELTLVLSGGFSDESGQYGAGDVAEADDSVTHRPMADPGEDCICLAVTDAPLKLTGPLSRLLNPFIRD